MNYAGKQHTRNGVSRVYHWIIDKLLPWALMGILVTVVGFGIEMLTWRVSVDKDIEAIKKLMKRHEEATDVKESIMELKVQIKALNTELAAFNSQLPRSHVNREEFKEHTRQLERRIDKLEAITR